MALGDALYSMVISAGRVEVVQKSAWDTTTQLESGGVKTRAAVVANQLYITKVSLLTSEAAGATYKFLEIFSDVENATVANTGFLWSEPIVFADQFPQTSAKIWGKTEINFFQPLRVNSVGFVVREGEPFNGSAGTLDDIVGSGADWRLIVEGYPRNFS